jgi:nitroreductase
MYTQKIKTIREMVAERFSPNTFTDQPVSDELINDMLDVARWAPSSYNEQPWKFLVTRKGEENFQKVYQALKEGNQNWAGKAPILMVTLASDNYARNGRRNRHAWHDTGMAMGFFLMAGVEAGVQVHQMGGFFPERIEESIELPEGYHPVAVAAIGYTNELAAQESRTRKSLREIRL